MSATVWDDALLWLPTLEAGSARAVVFDPPYAVGTPVRGREDGAAGSVFGPLSFMSRTLRDAESLGARWMGCDIDPAWGTADSWDEFSEAPDPPTEASGIDPSVKILRIGAPS